MDKPRQYPPIYEKIVPFALGTLALIVIILVVVTVAVALCGIPTPG